LAGDAGGDDGERLGADVLAKLKILEVAEADGLVVAPDVGLALALLDGADGVLPVVDVVEASPWTRQPPGKRMNFGFRSAMTWARSARRPLGRLRKVFSGKSEM
jgi:hypothetical protein